MKPLTLREQALVLRKRGYSYGMIANKLGLAKSTLSNWLQKVPFTPNKEVLRRIGEARMKMAATKRKQMMDNIQAMKKLARKDIGKLSKRDLFLLGVGLYLGDGEKTYENVRIINSDPEIIRVAAKWFRNVCGLKTKNFRPRVYLYPDTDIQKTIAYWSKILKVPKNQFMKVQIDRRTNKSDSKKGKLPYGTLHLQANSCGDKKFGKNLHRRIMGWIKVIEEQI